LQPGANPDALLKLMAEDVLLTSKYGVRMYDAFKHTNVGVRV